jgi:HlyD family secretion protein
MNRKLLVLVAVLIAASVAFYFISTHPTSESNVIRVSGNIEIIDAEVSFKIPGRVEKRLVSEGDVIDLGQLVAELDSAALAQEVALRRAEVRASRAALAELEAGSRPEEIAEAAASVQRAQASLNELLAGSRPQELAAAESRVQSAKSEFDRLRVESERDAVLFKDGHIAAREYDASRSAYEMARARLREAEEDLKLVREGPRKEQIEAARASLAKEKERYTLIKKGPRQETIEQARARLQQSKEALAVAETNLGYATIRSPLGGLVLSKNIEPGEYVAAGTPIVTVGDLESPWLRAYINETDLGRVKVGQQVRVTTDTYPGKIYEGRISFIASEAEFTPKNVQTEKERVKLVYRIKVEIPNPNMELKPGMPADADILLDEAVMLSRGQHSN